MDSFQPIENICTAEITRDISQPIQEMIQPERTEFTRNISQHEITESQSAGQEPDGSKSSKSSKGHKKTHPETEGEEDRSKFVGQNRKIDGGSMMSKSSNSSKGDTNAQLQPKRQEDRSKSVAQKPETDSEPAMSKSIKSSKIEKRTHPEGKEGGTKSVGRKPQTTGESVVRKSSKFLKGDKNNLDQPPTSEMVIESIKSLKMRNGATEKAISKYIAENYNVNINVRSRHTKNSLMKGVEIGLLENVCRDGVTETFKIKKESTKKSTERKRNLPEEKLKDAKKVKKSVSAPGKKAKK